ncbi:MAG: hypothetical protein A2176_08985 [Spirochaetes bacterium RBG_13_51_14]|nr:MAG: hypothetical protein A2176_08985 [Spirochaetes bacterium RBG_13_51_14]
MKLIFLMAIAYLAGSVNFAILLFKFLGKDDPRASFSGNAGTTNVYRIAGPVWAAVVLLLDVGRAVLLALLSRYLLVPGQVPWVGLSLIIGNRYPCFHRFQGGKGVATYLGFTAAVAPVGAAIAALAWVAAYLIKRVPFIASFVMIGILGFGAIIACRFELAAIIGTVLSVLFILNGHYKNITEFMQKKETGKDNQEED